MTTTIKTQSTPSAPPPAPLLASVIPVEAPAAQPSHYSGPSVVFIAPLPGDAPPESGSPHESASPLPFPLVRPRAVRVMGILLPPVTGMVSRW
jgi:hypothetical protein